MTDRILHAMHVYSFPHSLDLLLGVVDLFPDEGIVEGRLMATRAMYNSQSIAKNTALHYDLERRAFSIKGFQDVPFEEASPDLNLTPREEDVPDVASLLSGKLPSSIVFEFYGYVRLRQGDSSMMPMARNTVSTALGLGYKGCVRARDGLGVHLTVNSDHSLVLEANIFLAANHHRADEIRMCVGQFNDLGSKLEGCGLKAIRSMPIDYIEESLKKGVYGPPAANGASYSG